jgi:hypothetical protein
MTIVISTTFTPTNNKDNCQRSTWKHRWQSWVLLRHPLLIRHCSKATGQQYIGQIRWIRTTSDWVNLKIVDIYLSCHILVNVKEDNFLWLRFGVSGLCKLEWNSTNWCKPLYEQQKELSFAIIKNLTWSFSLRPKMTFDMLRIPWYCLFRECSSLP